LLLIIDGETNGLRLQWVPYISGTTAHDVPLLIWNLLRGDSGAKGLIYMPCKKFLIRMAALPVERLEAHR